MVSQHQYIISGHECNYLNVESFAEKPYSMQSQSNHLYESRYKRVRETHASTDSRRNIWHQFIIQAHIADMLTHCMSMLYSTGIARVHDDGCFSIIISLRLCCECTICVYIMQHTYKDCISNNSSYHNCAWALRRYSDSHQTNYYCYTCSCLQD